MSIACEDLEQQLAWRYATQLFDASRKIPERVWQTLETALVGSPSSFGLQPWRFVLVEDSGLRTALKTDSWNQSQVTDASHFLVLAAKTRISEADVDAHLQHTAFVRGIDAATIAGQRLVLTRFFAAPDFDHEDWSTRQVYLALGMLLSSAALLGIDACPMEGIDTQSYDRLLGLPALGFSAKVACALGYRSPLDTAATEKKVRFPISEVVLRR